MKKRNLAWGALMVLGLVGCASQPTPIDQRAVDANRQVETDRLVQSKLLESSESIDRTLRLIEGIERGPRNENREVKSGVADAGASASKARTAPVEPQSGVVSDPLDTKLVVKWKNAPVDELLSRLAQQLGASLKISGNMAGKMPVVRMDTGAGESMRRILEQVAAQLEGRADLIYNKKNAVLELRFK